jgi:hypothetical protein
MKTHKHPRTQRRVYPEELKKEAVQMLPAGAEASRQALHPTPGPLADSLFGKRVATIELTLRAAAPLACGIA